MAPENARTAPLKTAGGQPSSGFNSRARYMRLNTRKRHFQLCDPYCDPLGVWPREGLGPRDWIGPKPRTLVRQQRVVARVWIERAVWQLAKVVDEPMGVTPVVHKFRGHLIDEDLFVQLAPEKCSRDLLVQIEQLTDVQLVAGAGGLISPKSPCSGPSIGAFRGGWGRRRPNPRRQLLPYRRGRHRRIRCVQVPNLPASVMILRIRDAVIRSR